MKTIKDYHDLYLKCNILMLPDIFKKIRNNDLKNYGLCWGQYLSAPALSWDGMPYMTKINFELLLDPDMYIFFEKGVRGGVSYIPIDTVKPGISIWNLMTHNKTQNILHT